MKRHILIMFGTVFFGLLMLAVAAPDLSGSWVRDAAKSDPFPDANFLTRPPSTGGGGGGRGRGNAEQVMTVKLDANNLLVTSPQGERRKYTVDGKDYTSTASTGMAKVVTKANWQGDTLVIDTSQPFGGMPGNVTLRIKDVWSLSADGKVLTITTNRSIPAGDKISKQIYNRK